MSAPSKSLITVLALALILVAGCTSAPEKSESAQRIALATARAAQLERNGDLVAAAREYEQVAATAPVDQRAQLQLQALRLLVRAQSYERGERLYGRIDEAALPASEILQLHLLGAAIAAGADEWQQVLRRLGPSIDVSVAPIAQQQRYHELRAQGYSHGGQPFESFRERLELDRLLAENTVSREQNHESMLNNLNDTPRFTLEENSASAADLQSKGWLQLALILKGYPSNAEDLEADLQIWRLTNPQHPLAPAVLAQFLEELRQRYLPPSRIAVILPSSGPLAEAAAALRDGFLAAYFHDDVDRRPEIRFLASGPTDDIVALYERAVREGAELVVGPLEKEAVRRLAQSEALQIPVLALNRIETSDSSPEHFYQFGLPPEDEAVLAADRAHADGHRRALILVPEGAWGSRVATAFGRRWTELGGMVLEHQVYPPGENDYASAIKKMLNLDGSRARYRALRQTLGESVGFEPRRRQDLDFVFVGAFPRQARILRPQLRFHHAEDVPVVATSHVFSGWPDPEKDRDMDGLEFCDMPWVLIESSGDPLSRESFRLFWPEDRSRFGRLYAMGIDAYGVLAHLSQLASGDTPSFAGVTGELRLDERGQLRRNLLWARFSKGLPQVIAEPGPGDESELDAASGGSEPFLGKPVTQPADEEATSRIRRP